jgi:2-desacetyl-2-hydroxyethyl bacteriochlorophyllide A dehydrogenase
VKACAILEPGRAATREIAEPEAGEGEVLVRIRQLGLCGTDLKAYLGQNPLVTYPRVIGHETAGEVVRLGAGVPGHFESSLHPGTRVTLYPYTQCGKCSSCRKGRTNCCRYNQTMGVQRDGAATALVSVPAAKVVTAEGLDWDQITLIEPLSVGFHAVSRGGVGPGDRVAVFGCGMIGLGAIAGSARTGGEVIAIDIDAAKLETAKALGAWHVINSASEDLRNRIDELTDGHGADVVIEAVGLPQTFRGAVDIVCFAGTVVYIGYAKSEVSYDTSLFVAKELDIRGSRNAMPQDFANVIAMLKEGKTTVASIVTQRYPFARAGEALAFWQENTARVTKIVIDRFEELGPSSRAAHDRH